MAIKKKSSSASQSATITTGKKTGDVAWEMVDTEFTPESVFMQLHGLTGCGRSSFALSAPGPIAYIHTNEKVKGIIEPFAKIKEIRAHNFAGTFFGTLEQKREQAMDSWRAFRRHYLDAYKWARTIVIDTDTELWSLLRLAFFGDFKPEGGRVDREWGPVNAEWMSIIKRYRSQTKTNLILLGQSGDEYAPGASKNGKQGMDQKTGRMVRSGQKQIPYLADVGLYLKKRKGVLSVDIEKAWMNAEYEMEDAFSDVIAKAPLGKRNVTFANIMSFITETEEGDWK